MKRLNDFLTESLNTPVEFFITDDTKIPERIAGLCTINGTTYGMSLEKSTFHKIYILSFYRVLNVKPRYWSFRKPTDIRPALSTVLKFVEGSIPFLKPHMDGIIIKPIAKTVGRNFERLVTLAVKRLYQKSLTTVSTTQTGKPGASYVFIVRKTVSPKTLFKSKQFKKYDFGWGVPIEAMDEIDFKKIQKKTISKKASKKYTFKGMNLSKIEGADEIYNQITDIKSNGKVSYKEYQDKKNGVKEEEKKEIKIEKYTVTSHNMKYILAALMPDMTNKLNQYGFDESKFNVGNFNYVLQNLFSKQDSADILHDFMYEKGYINDSNELTKKGEAKIKINLKSIGDNLQLPIAPKVKAKISNLAKQTIDYKASKILHAENKKENAKSSDDSYYMTNHTIETTDIDFDSLRATVTMPGVGKAFKLTSSFGSWGKADGENTQQANNYIEDDLGYREEIIHKWTEKERQALSYYTGSSYHSFNGPLRQIGAMFSQNKSYEDLSSFDKEDFNLAYKKYIKPFKTGIDKLTPLPEPIIVYRGGFIPEPERPLLKAGGDYIDPAFISTSLRSTFEFGQKNVKFEIFIPEGSKILPALTHSMSGTEKEIILPPFSVQKIASIETFDPSHSSYGTPWFFIRTILIGSVYDSFTSNFLKYNKLKEGYIMTEAKKSKETKTYDPHKKYGGEWPKAEFTKKMQQQIKSGKLKFDKKKK